jgi:ribonuclease P protein component
MGPASPHRLGLGRDQRLKHSREFSRLRREGQRLAYGSLVANWLPAPPSARVRLGVITSGKLGNATVRSRARRLLREAFRMHQHDFTGPVDLVLVARQSITHKKLTDVERDLLTAMRKARLLKSGAPATEPFRRGTST